MAPTLFDRPLFVQRKRYIEEIATLEDAFDLLEAWPAEDRGLAHEVVMDACQQAHAGKFPLGAFRTNLERFLKRENLLADVQEMPDAANRISPSRRSLTSTTPAGLGTGRGVEWQSTNSLPARFTMHDHRAKNSSSDLDTLPTLSHLFSQNCEGDSDDAEACRDPDLSCQSGDHSADPVFTQLPALRMLRRA